MVSRVNRTFFKVSVRERCASRVRVSGVQPAQPARDPALDIRDLHLGAAAALPAELLLSGGYREQLSTEQNAVVLVAVAAVVINEAVEEVLREVLHLAR